MLAGNAVECFVEKTEKLAKLKTDCLVDFQRPGYRAQDVVLILFTGCPSPRPLPFQNSCGATGGCSGA